jgi:hypothetical protein
MTEQTELETALEKYKGKAINLLLPVTHIAGLSEFHAVAVSEVTINTDPDAGEVYPDDESDEKGDKKKYRFHKTAYLRISACAGLQWSPSQSGIEKMDRDYIAFKSVAYLLMPDGQPYAFVGHDDIDFLNLDDDLREKYTKKSEAKDKQGNYYKRTEKERREYVDYCVSRDIRFKRSHKLALVETGAMERVIKGILALKNSYTLEELKRPFVIARVVYRPDYSNEMTRRMAVNQGNAAALDIFGPATKQTHDITPIPEEKEPGDAGNGTGPGQPPDTTESQVLDFTNATVDDQATTLYELARRKGYDLQAFLVKSKLAAPMGMKPERRAEMFRYLLGLPDPQQKPVDDVPFD